MNIEHINPFITSTVNVITTMAFVKINQDAPYINTNNNTTGAVTGVIGLAGNDVVGSVIISFTAPAILEIVSGMLSEKFTEITPEVEDAVGEITNMITGGAKRILYDKGYKFNLALPTIVTGEKVNLNLKTKGPRVVVPFRLAASGALFTIEICIEKSF